MMSTCEFNAIATIGGEMYKKNASQGIVDVYKLFHTSLTVELCWNLNIILMSFFNSDFSRNVVSLVVEKHAEPIFSSIVIVALLQITVGYCIARYYVVYLPYNFYGLINIWSLLSITTNFMMFFLLIVLIVSLTLPFSL